MVGTTIIYDNRSTCSRRMVLNETVKDGRRVYILRDLDNPESKQIPAVADAVDKIFAAQKGKIRADKYSDSAFHKRRKKAGRFSTSHQTLIIWTSRHRKQRY